LSVWTDPSKTNEERVGAFDSYIRREYLFSHPDTAALLAEQLFSYAGDHQYPRASAIANNLKGGVCLLQGNLAAAKEHFETSQMIFDEAGDKKGVANSLMNLGNVYKDLGKYSRSLEFFQRSLQLNEEINNQIGIANNLNNIGLIYKDLRNYTRSLEYLEKALAMMETLGDKRGVARVIGNIGIIHDMQGNLSLALSYYERGLALHKEMGDKIGMAGSLGNIGYIHKFLGDYERALNYFEEAQRIYEVMGNKKGIASGLNNIGLLYSAQGKNVLAIKYCHKGLEMAEKIGVLDIQRISCECLYSVYKKTDNQNEALSYIERMRTIEDSLYEKETSKRLEQMELSRAMLQDSIAKADEVRIIQENYQAEVRKKNQTRNILIATAVFLLLLTSSLYSRWRYVRNAKRVIEKEKDRSENLLLNILPADVAEELKEKGRSEARNYDDVSILFTDFKGFTEASAKLSAQDLVTEINVCFEAFDNIVAEHGIEKIKTIGDAYMAAGGLPVPTPDSARNTVMAALAMQDFIRRRKAENEALGKPAFEMRVGIHTGPVVAGIVGVKKFQYDIWGDTVNTASRMESSGEPGKVNISSATYELVKDQFTCEYRGEIEVKGKGKMGMYFAGKAIR
jgi:class 3 adenylate cyclase